MAKGISTKIRVQDGMSGPLRSMTKALNVALSGFEAMQTASSQAVDVSAIHEAQQELARMPAYLDDWEREIEQANRGQENLNQTIREGSNAADGLVKKVGKLVAAYASVQTVQAALNYADDLTQTEARLKMINKGGDTIEELEDKIRASAKRARATYAGTADIVAKLGQRAGNAFSSNDELIRFTETLNKMFVVAGASAEEQQSASHQLLQALGSGVLRGEEFNAVFESAPNIMQEVADYMGKPIEKLRKMAEDGQITAGVVKNALLGASSEVDTAFNSIPVTWAQVFTMAKESALEALGPVFARIQQIGSSQAVQNIAQNIGVVVSGLASILLTVFDLVAGIGNFVVENWSLFPPIIMAVVSALGAYAIYQGISNVATWLSNASLGIQAVHAYAAAKANTTLSSAKRAEAMATASATAAQYGFNAALLASPLTWILIIIVAIIAAVYGVVAVINKVTGSTISATGVIMGALAVVGAFLVNLLMGTLDMVLGFINYLVNPFIAFVNFFGNLFNDPIASIIHLFGDFADRILGVIESIAKALDKVFGSNLAGAVQNWRSGLNEMVEGAANKHGNGSYEKVVNELNLSTDTFGWDRLQYGKSYDAGYGLGEGIDAGLGSFLDGVAVDDAAGAGYVPEDIPPYDEIAKNTGDTAKALETTEEDLKYLRDIAEREAINRFTTAEIKIDMKNDMKVNNGADLNGMINYLEETLYEKMSAAASGVY